jgi:hypothetical protein
VCKSRSKKNKVEQFTRVEFRERKFKQLAVEMISDEVERMQQCCAEMRTVQPVDTRNVALPIRVEKRWQDARRIEKR